MKVLVTGASGFIGKNLCLRLKEAGIESLPIDKENIVDLEKFIKAADFCVHLAGINRPLEPKEFYDGNANLTYRLIELIKQANKRVPIAFASSTQAALDNDYGKSKKMAEDYLLSFQKETGNPVYVYRFQNVFGKWCRPNYNSVVATFCYNIAHDLPIKVSDPSARRDFIYIDDICGAVIDLIKAKEHKGSNEILYIKPSYDKSIGEIANLIQSFKDSRFNLMLPDQGDEFDKKLYATYLSYLPEDNGFAYPLNSHVDNRGSFTEFYRTDGYGQLSVNVSKPGITKGNHYHHTKNEKFLVVKGTCSIKFRKIGGTKVYEYVCSGDNLVVVDIPCGYTHSITNIGTEDSVTIMWASELFDPNNPDTIYEEV